MIMLNMKRRRHEKKEEKRSTEKKEKSIKLTIMRFQRVSFQNFDVLCRNILKYSTHLLYIMLVSLHYIIYDSPCNCLQKK